MMNKRISAGLVALTLSACASFQKPATLMSVRVIGTATLPHKMAFQNTIVGGLSGIDYDAENDLYYLLSDDRSDNGPARFYTGTIQYDATSVKSVTLTAAHLLRQPDGSVFPDKNKGGEVPDPEAIRFRADTKTLLWTSEGDKRLGLSPFIREIGWHASARAATDE
jgi:Esterase-like activity of phytase